LIPIIAFPVINMEKDKIFPNFVDFGLCLLNQRKTHKYEIISRFPVNFKYEFISENPHPYFKIYPMKGIIQGQSSIEVWIDYLPLKAKTVSMELWLHID